MNGQKFAVAALVGGVTCFILGYVIYGVLLAGYMSANMMPGLMKDPPDFIHLGLGNLASGALLATVIGGWAKTGGVGPGLKIGAILGVLVAASFDLTMFGTSNVMTNPDVMLVDICASTVLTALAGAAVGAALGRRA
jgi:hypothetical protein